jgi:hypothetical protein
MSTLHNIKHTDHTRLWSFEGMLLPLGGFFSTFGESIHGLISFDHLKIGRAVGLTNRAFSWKFGVTSKEYASLTRPSHYTVAQRSGVRDVVGDS